MPLYTITTQVGVLDDPAKADLAEKLTAFHAEYAAVPKNWVHIVFQEYPIGSGFSTGRPSQRRLSRC
jgi:phenylpyruvate tautomerase PptA (4-oxalocrotonate tautomerase family)